MEQLNLSMAEAAKLIMIHPSRMRSLLVRGVIPAWKDGRDWKIPISCLQKWNEEQAIREAAIRRKNLNVYTNPYKGNQG